MSHGILDSRLIYARKDGPAWHGLGTPFDDPISATEGLEMVNGNFELRMRPLYAMKPNGHLVPTSVHTLVRVEKNGDYKILGQPLTETYRFLANDTLAKMVDPLVDRDNGIGDLATIGILHDGAGIFFSIDSGEWAVKDDPHKTYFLLTDMRDGKSSLHIAYTPVRVVCQNTVTYGLNQSDLKVAIAHTPAIARDTEFFLNLFARLRRIKEKSQVEYSRLAEIAVTPPVLMRIEDELWPIHTNTRQIRLLKEARQDLTITGELEEHTAGRLNFYQRTLERVNALNELKRSTFRTTREQFDADFPRFAGTLYSAFNAGVETIEYSSAKHGVGDAQFSRIWGGRATQRKDLAEVIRAAASV